MGTKVFTLPENPCEFCKKRKATRLCDFVVGEFWTSIDFKTKRFTCDKPICDECALKLNDHFDFCPTHKEHVKKLLGVKR